LEGEEKETAALKMTRELVGMDTSWKKSISSEVPDKTIDLGKADYLDDGVRKNIGVQDKEREGQQSDTTYKNGDANKEQPSKNRTNNYTPLLIAASKGKKYLKRYFNCILKQLSTLVRMRKTYCMWPLDTAKGKSFAL
jgi:hypothetical protein